MSKRRPMFLAVLMAGLLVVPSTLPSATQAQAGAADTQEQGPDALQTAFQNASQEFGVPLNVLMSVAYNESRWEQHLGQPSLSGGYGVMHLTHLGQADLSARGETGDESAATEATPALPANNDPSVNTLDAAAVLLGTNTEVLKTDLTENVRGGAALLAQYARETVGNTPSDAADWYGAVAKYSGSDLDEIAQDFADDVYATIQTGQARTTPEGQTVTLAADAVTPNKTTANSLHLRNAKKTGTDCPNGLECREIPALYQQFSASQTDYGNYDIGNRQADGDDIRYIIIHDIEGTYEAGISTFLSKSYVSAHYVVNNVDGQVTEMVNPKDVAWQAGNWYINSHSIGIEHGGIAAEGGAWYSEQMYHASAKLVKYLAKKYDIPLDRQHILGHDDLPGTSQATQRSMHWDPGAYWDWSHYFDLLGAPINPSNGNAHNRDKQNNPIVTINPHFSKNQPSPVLYGSQVLDPQPSNFLYLYQAPSFDAPLLSDPALHAAGVPGTTQISDWGDKATIGQTFYKADQQGDWTAIWYGAQKAWFYNPSNSNTTPGRGILVTPKAGKTSIPVYGTAYPEAEAFAAAGIPRAVNNPLQYNVTAGQVYVSAGTVPSDYFYAKLFNLPETYQVVKGKDEFYQISFNHRIAFVKASDVDIVQP
ncbi:N-acetylmuramoyl-L-alanine amidase [Tumebacillus flagellatus]|uniref:N-acetylmuramoyl-L-alanine amidase n=1 Tax=Tumebacillus flagellatus TaxID=1157490 RepID=A0A074MGP7_9BACL|nr:N-acetylmuramoyl-L-alanine amidase [Tumebacillus flagellatus]KEO84902.1 N-acetylmuramoyl-L-alanine amidase [Tumebacillus flagellatus]